MTFKIRIEAHQGDASAAGTRNVITWAARLGVIAGLGTACGGAVAGNAVSGCDGTFCADANNHDALGGATSHADGFSGVVERADVLADTGSDSSSTLVEGTDSETKPDASNVPWDVDAGAVADASPETGVDASGILTTAQLLKNVSADCFNCAMTHCPSSCEQGSLVGEATSGPAAGTSKRVLCIETLMCELSTGCFVGDQGVTPCYCGPTTPATCWSMGGPTGPCRQQWERSFEDTYPLIVYQRLIDSQYGGSVANRIAQCLHDNHCFCP